MKTYHFTDKQLDKLLRGTIALYAENILKFGEIEQDGATAGAVTEVFEALEADQELVEAGDADRLMLQLPDMGKILCGVYDFTYAWMSGYDEIRAARNVLELIYGKK